MNYFYLDVGPMILALRQKPSEFEIRYDRLRHRPSRHLLAFHRNVGGRIVARCNCTEFPIRPEQAAALSAAISNWERSYWRPLMAREAAERRMTWINLISARDFGVTALWHQAIAAIRAWFGIGVRVRRRRISKPHLRVLSSLPDDPNSDAGAPPGAPTSRDNRSSVR
jgi:hypothetical protein